MILTKEVEVKWNGANRVWFESKGYGPYMNRQPFIAKIEDLNHGSKCKIDAICDYCNTLMEGKTYKDYMVRVNNHLTKKYACYKCTKKKAYEANMHKSKLGLMKKTDMGYYKVRENRMRELRKYLEENKTIDGIWDTRLYAVFNSHKHDILEAIKELGYDESKMRSQKPKGYWDNIEPILEAVETFIRVYDRFPRRDDLRNEFNVCNKAINNHGGMNTLRKLVNYQKDTDLIDKNGDLNRSTYELITANFLIENRIDYKREQYPFPRTERRFRSDFTFTYNGEVYHIEVWGFPKGNYKSPFSAFYNEKRKEKEKLYKKYGINLISIEFEVFEKTQDEIQQELKNLLKPYTKKEIEERVHAKSR